MGELIQPLGFNFTSHVLPGALQPQAQILPDVLFPTHAGEPH